MVIDSTIVGDGYVERPLTNDEASGLIRRSLLVEDWKGKRVLLILPDSTRSAPVGLLYKTIFDAIGHEVDCMDGLIALGTHQAMTHEEILKRIEISHDEYKEIYGQKSKFFNHEWDNPNALIQVGKIDSSEVERISGGLMNTTAPISVNKIIFDYDCLMILGPVFPHEIVGFSGGNKYFFPGICGEDILNVFHWLGGLITNAVINGKKDTPVRDMINRSADFIDVPRLYFNIVVNHGILHGLYIGDGIKAWGEAVDLSSLVNIHYTGRRYKTVIGIAPRKYDELWTAGKVAYKAETIVEDGGRLIIYAPHITEISFTHGEYIERVGYHVKDYFASRMDRFSDIPGSVLSHLVAVKGIGRYFEGLEEPRIQVVLATSIPKSRCERINLGFEDYSEIDIGRLKDGSDGDTLIIEDAGEVLYKEYI